MKLTKPIIVGNQTYPKGTDCVATEEIDVSMVPLDATDYQLHTELNQQIWNYESLKPEIRDRLLQIANEFYDSTGFKAEIKDIIFTGSLANYNYHAGSDVDLHIVIDFNEENEDNKLVQIAANSVKWKWNQEHNITIFGYEVETYIQDFNEPHNSSGIYSILNDVWIVKPQYRTLSVDTDTITKKSDTFKYIIDDIESQVQKVKKRKILDEHVDMIDHVRYKVLRLRKDAFENGEDEFSTGNLVFKELRNSGYIEKLMNLERSLYDKSKTL